MLVQTEGIVLRQRRIAGNRRMLVLFTKKYGKLNAGTSINERGKSKAALALRPFTYADYDIFKSSNSSNINNAQAKKSYYSIGEDLDRFAIASKLIEYLDAILEEEQASPAVFDLTIELLDSLSIASSREIDETLLYAFIVKTLKIIGFLPELSGCADCGKHVEDFSQSGKKEKIFFSISAGGVLCDDCAREEKKEGDSLLLQPSFDIVNVLRYFVKNPISRFEKLTLKPQASMELRKLLSEYIKYYMDIDLLDSDFRI